MKEEQKPTKEQLKRIQTPMTIVQLWIICVLIQMGATNPNLHLQQPIVALDCTRNYAPTEGLVREDQREHKRQLKEN